MRAEIALRRLSRQAYSSEDDGVVWIERRRRFFNREYLTGERVGMFRPARTCAMLLSIALRKGPELVSQASRIVPVAWAYSSVCTN